MQGQDGAFGKPRGCLPCSNCLVTVPQDQWYTVEKCGRFVQVLRPGLACVGLDVCGACYAFRSLSTRVEVLNCSVTTKTKDNVFLKLKVAVHFSVNPGFVHDAMYKLGDVSSQIDAYVSDVVRSTIPMMTLDEAYEKKDGVSWAVLRSVELSMSDFGFQIHKALVAELSPDAHVLAAMNEINTQKRLRDAAVVEAESGKIHVVKAAEARAVAVHLQGLGIARQRAAIIQGLKDTIASDGEVLSTQVISELLLMTQYFETLKIIGAGSGAVFIPHDSGVAEVSPGQAIM